MYASALLFLLPALALAADSIPEYTEQHQKSTPIQPALNARSLVSREVQCDAGLLPCQGSIGCCGIGKYCTTVAGTLGCCPIGDVCDTILGCSVGYYECAASLGGGCCRFGTTCTVDGKCHRGGSSGSSVFSSDYTTLTTSSTSTEVLVTWTQPALPTRTTIKEASAATTSFTVGVQTESYGSYIDVTTRSSDQPMPTWDDASGSVSLTAATPTVFGSSSDGEKVVAAGGLLAAGLAAVVAIII